MTDSRYSPDAWDGSEAWEEVESLIGAAGSYVQPSEDLRPRVLEAAQRQVGGRNLCDGLRRLALITLVASTLTTLLTPAPMSLELPRHGQVGAAQFAPEAGLDGPAFEVGTHGVDRPQLDGGNLERWRDVEAFTGARRRQAELLRLAPTSSGRPGA